MGCDIHLHIELRKETGEWRHYAAPQVMRDYSLFEKMSGVRGDVKNAIASPRGIPEDASDITKAVLSYESLNAHSLSYLSSEEVDHLCEWYSYREKGMKNMEWDVMHTFLMGHSFTAFLHYNDTRYIPEGFVDLRFVFWFDN